MKKGIKFGAFVLAALLMPLAPRPVLAKDNLTSHDKKFVESAGSGGLLEVKLGELATKQAASEDVKDFGRRMVTDHSKANQELADIGQKDGFSVPKKLNKKHQKTYEKLSKLKGAEFDRAYTQDMVKDHKEDIADFQKEAKEGKNQDLKQFAEQTIPTLQEHLNMAKKADAEVHASK